MDSVDLEVLKSSARWLADGHRVLLVAVVKTWGSSPRPVGAMLAGFPYIRCTQLNRRTAMHCRAFESPIRSLSDRPRMVATPQRW